MFEKVLSVHTHSKTRTLRTGKYLQFTPSANMAQGLLKLFDENGNDKEMHNECFVNLVAWFPLIADKAVEPEGYLSMVHLMWKTSRAFHGGLFYL